MARSNFDFNRSALVALAASGEVQKDLSDRAIKIRNEARSTASSISSDLSGAIEVEAGGDAKGKFADIGYLKSAPGFVLWWHEVGTVQYPATPHLRPALKAGS